MIVAWFWRQKSDDSKEFLILQDSFIKKALKNFKRALGLEKEALYSV